jgi:hypothetical protein
MIRTRPTETQTEDLGIIGDGPYLLALHHDQLELIGCFMGMIRGGHSLYQEAAADLMDILETATGDQDFCLTSLEAIMPTVNVHEPLTYDLIAQYDEDHSFEFNV